MINDKRNNKKKKDFDLLRLLITPNNSKQTAKTKNKKQKLDCDDLTSTNRGGRSAKKTRDPNDQDKSFILF